MKKSIFAVRRDRPLTPLELYVYQHYRIIHGIRMAVAFVLTFLIIRMANLPDHSWPLITLVVVMGPISFWGNVIPRAFERMVGTVTGAVLGMIALHIEMYSLPLMLAWCGCAAFLCGYLTMSKRPYAALLIGITLAVVSSAPAGDIQTALWRSTNIILGCLLAIVFTSIYPQRAFIHWRIQLSSFLSEFSKMSASGFSWNVLSRPNLTKLNSQVLANVEKMRTLIIPVSKETGISTKQLGEIQSIARDMIATQELQIEAHWASRSSRFIILNSHTLAEAQQMTQRTLQALAQALHEGNPSPAAANRERLNDITKELHELLLTHAGDDVVESAVHGYVWLSIQLGIKLERLSTVITEALTEQSFHHQPRDLAQTSVARNG